MNEIDRIKKIVIEFQEMIIKAATGTTTHPAEYERLRNNHAMEMFQKGDKDHLKAGDKMKELMQNPEAMKEWFDNKRKEFDSLPEDK